MYALNPNEKPAKKYSQVLFDKKYLPTPEKIFIKYIYCVRDARGLG
jgi:hypothetical protein